MAAQVRSVQKPELQDMSEPGFAEAVLIEDAGMAPSSVVPANVVDLARSNRFTIAASAPPALVAATLRALR